jgi:DNA modification methylase
VIHVLPGDCLAVLATLPADRADAVVTDPPYGLEFMRLGLMLPGGGGMGDMDF